MSVKFYWAINLLWLKQLWRDKCNKHQSIPLQKTFKAQQAAHFARVFHVKAFFPTDVIFNAMAIKYFSTFSVLIEKWFNAEQRQNKSVWFQRRETKFSESTSLTTMRSQVCVAINNRHKQGERQFKVSLINFHLLAKTLRGPDTRQAAFIMPACRPQEDFVMKRLVQETAASRIRTWELITRRWPTLQTNPSRAVMTTEAGFVCGRHRHE